MTNSSSMSRITGNSPRIGEDHGHQATSSSSSCPPPLEEGLKKGPWTAEEDQKLVDYIMKHGHGRWRTLPKNAGLKRCGKSCRLRWTNYLRPDIKRGRFSDEEEDAIIQLHRILGNKWSAIAARLPGRTDNEIKNYWNTHIKKKLMRMGIDPVTHAPRFDLLQLSSILSSPLYDYARHLNLPDSIGAMGSTIPNQNRIVLDLAKQLTVISQNSDQGTPLGSVESVSANKLQSQNQIQEQNISPNPNYVGGQCHPLPLSSWDVSHGGFGPHDPNSSVAEDPVHIGYSSDQYLDSFQFQSSFAGPANAFRYSTAEEVLQKPGESPALSSLTSPSTHLLVQQ